MSDMYFFFFRCIAHPRTGPSLSNKERDNLFSMTGQEWIEYTKSFMVHVPGLDQKHYLYLKTFINDYLLVNEYGVQAPQEWWEFINKKYPYIILLNDTIHPACKEMVEQLIIKRMLES